MWRLRVAVQDARFKVGKQMPKKLDAEEVENGIYIIA